MNHPFVPHGWTDKLNARAASSDRVQRACEHAGHQDIHDLITQLHYEHGTEIPHAVLYQYETKAIPGPDFLRSLQAQFPAEYEQIENLTIAKRLGQIHFEEARGQLVSASRHTALLPARYWQVALEAHNKPKAWDTNENKPDWAALILPLETEGEYLRAVRNALGLSPCEVARENNLSEATIRRAENGNHGAQSMRQGLLGYYETKEAHQRESGALAAQIAPLVSAHAYDRMDPTPSHGVHSRG